MSAECVVADPDLRHMLKRGLAPVEEHASVAASHAFYAIGHLQQLNDAGEAEIIGQIQRAVLQLGQVLVDALQDGRVDGDELEHITTQLRFAREYLSILQEYDERENHHHRNATDRARRCRQSCAEITYPLEPILNALNQKRGGLQKPIPLFDIQRAFQFTVPNPGTGGESHAGEGAGVHNASPASESWKPAQTTSDCGAHTSHSGETS